MKQLLVLVTGLFLSACAHETTTMDRELALKLADRPAVHVIQAAPAAAPIVNVNINGGGGQSTHLASQPVIEAPLEDTRTNCMESPIYNSAGGLVRMQRHCFGGN